MRRDGKKTRTAGWPLAMAGVICGGLVLGLYVAEETASRREQSVAGPHECDRPGCVWCAERERWAEAHPGEDDPANLIDAAEDPRASVPPSPELAEAYRRQAAGLPPNGGITVADPGSPEPVPVPAGQ